MKLGIFKRVTLDNGALLEYREFPAHYYLRFIQQWFALPKFIVKRLSRFALQRRIDGGPWVFFVNGVGR